MIDVEVHYTEHGDQRPPPKPGRYGESCQYTGNISLYQNQSAELKESSIIIGTIIKCFVSLLTSLSMLLLYWYAELERRLLVIR